MKTLDVVALVEVLTCWLLWVYPFISLARQQRGKQSVVMAPHARRGIWLQAFAFFLAWLRLKEVHQPAILIAAMLIAPLSALLAWQAVRHLGKQWRVQAGLYADHELIRTGPYAVIRHPIYLSMLGMMLATGLVNSWWPVVLVAIAFFIAGIEIRIRAEDTLLATRFGETFRNYQASVPAYIPLVR